MESRFYSALNRGPFWGGITLVLVWLAVLFVGVFGGEIKTAGSDGSASSWPVVVIVAIVALIATVSIGRWAFRPNDSDEDLRKGLEDEQRKIEALTAQVEEFRSKLSPPDAPQRLRSAGR